MIFQSISIQTITDVSKSRSIFCSKISHQLLSQLWSVDSFQSFSKSVFDEIFHCHFPSYQDFLVFKIQSQSSFTQSIRSISELIILYCTGFPQAFSASSFSVFLSWIVRITQIFGLMIAQCFSRYPRASAGTFSHSVVMGFPSQTFCKNFSKLVSPHQFPLSIQVNEWGQKSHHKSFQTELFVFCQSIWTSIQSFFALGIASRINWPSLVHHRCLILFTTEKK